MSDSREIECQMRGLIEDLNRLRAERADLALAEKHGANSEAVRKRAYRRGKEYLHAAVVPPGPWDQDFDDHPEEVYEGDLGNGFRGRLVRNYYSGTWCGYVIVPDGHWSIDQDLTNSWITYHEGNKIGFDHSGSWDLKPIERVPEFSSENYWLPVQLGDHLEYTTFDKAWKEVGELLEHINQCAPKKEPPRSYAQVVVGK